MVTFDSLLVVCVGLQQVTLAFLLFVASRPRLVSGGWGLRQLGVRQRLRGARFFECAVYPRLAGWLRYSVQGLALCGLFLLYDIDLVFFFAEMTTYDVWTLGQFTLLLGYLAFFVGGLAYDLWRYGLLWSF